MLLEYSCPMRWNTRSAPERSTRVAMPGYFASNAFATFSASGRSTEVYQTTLPSFLAASISACVTDSAAGACASTRVANALIAASAVPAFRMSRRDSVLGIAILPQVFVFVARLALARPRDLNLSAPGTFAAADAARFSHLAARFVPPRRQRATACRRPAQPYSRGCCRERHVGSRLPEWRSRRPARPTW